MAVRKSRAKTKPQPREPLKPAPPTKPLTQLDPQRREEIAAIGVFILALLTLLGAFNLSGGLFLDWWVGFLRSTFGWGVYLAPFMLFALALWLVLDSLDRIVNIGWERPIGLTLAYLLLLAGLHWVSAIKSPLQAPGVFQGGGIIGWAIASLLIRSIGMIGGALALVALGAIALILLFNISLPEFFRRVLYVARITRNLPQELEQFKQTRPATHSTQPSFVPPVSAARPAAPFVTPRDLSKPSAQPLKPSPLTPQERETRTGEVAQRTPGSVRIVGGNSAQPVPISATAIQREWRLPDISEILEESGETEINEHEIRKRVRIIEETLSHFGVPAKVLEVNQGPSITQFGVEPGFVEQKGVDGKLHRVKVKVSRISTLQHDLELALASAPIRIEAPVPGRSFVGIEVPNSQIALVSMRSVMESERFKQVKAKTKLALALGQDVSGQATVADLATMPHLLIAGATGSGKSVCVNTIIASLICTMTPDDVRFVMVDPKRVELVNYNGIPHLIRPVVVEVDGAVSALKDIVAEMDRRFKLFAQKGARNIEMYNQAMEGREGGDAQRLPLLVVIVDELADLMMVAADEVERAITRLAQMARATGIHLILATQRPSVDVVTGLIKANFPSRISFAVTSQIDSRVVLDTLGAEKLLGRGDMLYMASDSSKLVRLQGCFLSDHELEKIVEHWKGFTPPAVPSTLIETKGSLVQTTFLRGPDGKKSESDDDLLPQALDVIRQSHHASVSLLQRKLRIGYTRAARLMELLEQQGVVGPDGGPTKGRVVLAHETVAPRVHLPPGGSEVSADVAPGTVPAARKNAREFKDEDFEDFTEKDWEDLDS